MSPTERPSERELRVNEAIAAYLEAADRGDAPSDDEFLARHGDIKEDLQSFLLNRRQFLQAADKQRHDDWRAGQRDFVDRLASFAEAGEPPTVVSPDALPMATEGVPAEAVTIAPRTEAPSQTGTKVRYFGDYELPSGIATGGMGVVWRARQVSLNRIVALKMILAGQFASRIDVERFRLEAEAAASLDHPNIVPIYEIGEHHGEQYFTMKLIEGTNLSRSIAAGQWPAANSETPLRIARLMILAARAVHHAHQRGILHRDLKPGNILLDRNGQPHVTDFGLAKRADGRERLPKITGTAITNCSPQESRGLAARSMTLAGDIVGTPSYMPPEQAAGRKDLTVAADIYSLGAIFYEMLAGRPPFRGSSELETLVQVMESQPKLPAEIVPGVDLDLQSICMKCLEKDPERRYPSAESLAADLERWLSLKPVEARKPGRLESIRKFYQRHGRAAVGTTLVLAWTLFVPLFFILATQARGIGSFMLLVLNLANICVMYYSIRQQQGFVTPLPGSPAYRQEIARRTLDAFAPLPRMAFRRDGKALAVAPAGKPIQLWIGDIATKPIALAGHNKKVTALAFSPDGNQLASGAWDRTIRLWDVSDAKMRAKVIRAELTVQSLTFRPDGKLLAGSCIDGVVRVWDTVSGQRVNSIA